MVSRQKFYEEIEHFLISRKLVDLVVPEDYKTNILTNVFSLYDKDGDNLLNEAEYEEFKQDYLSKFEKKSKIIGIDVGGTNTDAVLLSFPESEIIAFTKVSTTKDIYSGVKNSVQKIISSTEGIITIDDISSIQIGTTAFVNAVIQRSNYLSKVTVLRLCGPSTRGISPFYTFPDSLKNMIEGDVFYMDGGYHYTGKTESTEINRDQVIAAAHKMIDSHLINMKSNEKTSEFFDYLNVAIIGMFSPSNNTQELKVLEILKNEFKSYPELKYTITMSHRIGKIGLIERENASILNSSLRPYALRTIQYFEKAIAEIGFKKQFFFTQNDGTLVSSDFIANYPCLTFASGPVNSVRGASFLSKQADCIVADIGGTTCDVAILQKGFCRDSINLIEIGGVTTNFKMPFVDSIGLGGGSIIKKTEGLIQIGPESVGYLLTKSEEGGLAFGGKNITATDIALRKGLFMIENANLEILQSEISDTMAIDCTKEIINKLQKCIDKLKSNSDELHLVLVGGGAQIIPKDVTLIGIKGYPIIDPNYCGVANAIGAALSKVSYTLEGIYKSSLGSKENFIEKMKLQCLKEIADKKGSYLGLSEIYEVNDMSMSYCIDGTSTISIKAIGILDHNSVIVQKNAQNSEEVSSTYELFKDKLEESHFEFKRSNYDDEFKAYKFEGKRIEYNHVEQRNEWILGIEDLEYIGVGAAIYGSGGGGSPYYILQVAKSLISQNKKIRVIALEDIKPTELIYQYAFFGAPTCITEKLTNNTELETSSKLIKMISNISHPGHSQVIMTIEIGGLNSISPLCYAAECGLPVVDGDLMGRAYPSINYTTTAINDKQVSPITLSDDNYNSFTIYNDQVNDNRSFEKSFRNIVEGMSLVAGICHKPLDKDLFKYVVQNSLTNVWNLGRELIKAKVLKSRSYHSIFKEHGGEFLFEGKITMVNRNEINGYNEGALTISGFGEFSNQEVKVIFRNENLLAEHTDNKTGQKKIIGLVPDIISLLDVDNFQAILCEQLKFGQKAFLIRLPAPTLLATREKIHLTGWKSFGMEGYDHADYFGENYTRINTQI